MARPVLTEIFLAACLAIAACGRKSDDDPGVPFAANDDLYSTPEDSLLSVPAPGVLDNDTGGSLTAALVLGPANGSLLLNADGSFDYTPTGNYFGPDSFTYNAVKGASTVEATVTLNVTSVNDLPVANDDVYTTHGWKLLDTAALAMITVLDNDTDADGDALAAVQVAGPANGTLTLGDDGHFVYGAAAGFMGTDSFTYTCTDTKGDSNVATVTIYVTSINLAPVAGNDALSTGEDVPLRFFNYDLTTNDSDDHMQGLTLSVVATTTHGVLTVTPTGDPGIDQFVYVPAPDYSGDDAFTYKVNDGVLDSAPATVTITVRDFDGTPAVVYAAETWLPGSGARILRYPGDNSLPLPIWGRIGLAAQGFIVDPSGSAAYILITDHGTLADVYKVVLATQVESLVVSLGPTASCPYGLDFDSTGLLYTVWPTGQVTQINPANGVTLGMGAATGLSSMVIGFAMGPDDCLYVVPLENQENQPWIHKFDPGSGNTTPWGNVPPGFGAFAVLGGIAIDATGNVYISSMETGTILKYRDTSADGDATDAGEVVEWAHLPVQGMSTDGQFFYGFGMTAQGLAVNVAADWSSDSTLGVWLVQDAPGSPDGDADDPGEQVQVSPFWIHANDGGCVSGPR